MKTVRELIKERPLVLNRARPEWTVSIGKNVQGFHVRIVDTKSERIVREADFRRLDGACLAEMLHRASESEGNIPGMINCGQENCFRDRMFELWAAYHTVCLRRGKPITRYIGRKAALAAVEGEELNRDE